MKPADGTYYTFTVTAGTSATSFTGSNDQAKNLLSSLEPEKGSSIPVIHNIQAVSALPLTGGATPADWLLAGLVVAGLAAALAAVERWRRTGDSLASSL